MVSSSQETLLSNLLNILEMAASQTTIFRAEGEYASCLKAIYRCDISSVATMALMLVTRKTLDGRMWCGYQSEGLHHVAQEPVVEPESSPWLETFLVDIGALLAGEENVRTEHVSGKECEPILQRSGFYSSALENECYLGMNVIQQFPS